MRHMTVGDLKRMLEDHPDDARVLIMTQESYPFENSCAGICAREDFEEEGQEGGDVSRTGETASRTDVFLCEGSQLRYGSKDAWQHARMR